MASIDRVMALANEFKKKKKNKDHEINTSLINSMDLANEIKSGNKNALREYTYDPTYIAPIAVKEEESWIKKIVQVPEVYKNNTSMAKDLLSDGFQISDAFKMSKEIGKDTALTIGGTAADTVMGVGKGIANVGEGIGDAVTYGTAQIIDWAGNEKEADRLRRNASEDTINKLFEKPQGYVNKASVLGDTGDKVAEGIGYMASIWATGNVGGAIGGAIGVTDKAVKIGSTVGQSGLIFGNSTGSNMADIYQEYGTEGVTDGEAWAKSLGGAAIETVTEQLFGMFGKADTKIVNAMAKRASSSIGKVLTRLGGQAVGEGAEEIISYAGNWVLDRAVDAASKGEGATFAKEWSWEDMWEQAGIAALTALAMGGSSTSASIVDNKNANNTWKDAINETSRQQEISAQIESLEDQKAKLEKKMGQQGLTQTQIDNTLTEIQQVEQQISDLKTQAQIAPINTSVQDELTQEQYINELDALQREYLQAPDVHAQTVIQQQIDELQAQAEQQGLMQDTNAQQITNVDESELRKQNFAYQAQETDSDIKKAVYESASQVMNNTEKSHKFADVVAKIAEERGTTYKFTNNEQLKELGYAKENVTVNGLVNENGEVLINIDSAKALNTIVGHETTHLLEGTQEYEALKQVAIEYAKSKGDYDTKIAQLHSLYKDTNANIDNELVSDIVGDYLFTDEAFVRELSVKQPTLFEKIKNFISDLVVKFKGTDQEKQLRELQRSFEKAYKAQGTKTVDQTQYSLESSTNENMQQKIDRYSRLVKEMQQEGKSADDWVPYANEILRLQDQLGNAETKYSLSEATEDGTETLKKYNENKKKAYKNIADEFGGSASYWEANLEGQDKESVKRLLKRTDEVRDKYIKDNNIKIEAVYKPVEFRAIGSSNKNVQKFVKDNDITVSKLAKDINLRNEYFNIVEQALQEKYKTSIEDVQQITKQWKDYFEHQSHIGETIIWALKRFENDFELIKSGDSQQIDRIATEENVRKLLDESKEFDRYINKLVDPLFNDKPQLSTEELTELAQDTFGTTTNFSVGAYMTPDGKLLNFNENGYRRDHREIGSIGYDMQEFIDAGNIRMKPEGNGFELTLEPTAEQYNTLSDYIDTLNGEVYIEIDIGKNKYDGANYKEGTPTSKIISDLQYYFKNGKFPAKSKLADFRYSLSAKNEDIAPTGNWNVRGEDIKLQIEEAVAPLQETVEKLTEQVQEKIEGITEQIQTIQENVAPTSQAIVEQQGQEAGKTLTDEDMLPIAEDTTPEVESETTTESKVESPFDSRDITEVGKRSVKAYQYENPEVRPYFQEEAQNMLHDLDNTVKGEKTVTQVYNPYTGLYENAEWTGTTRQTTEAIAYLRDNYKYSYAQIRKGLNDIIEDNGKENNAVAKRIEFMLDERLREGYTTSDGIPIPANEDYINFLKEKQVTEYNRERLETLAIDENVPEEVVEETTGNTEIDQTNALEQYEASLQDELSPTVNAEHTVEYEPIDTSFMRESTKKKLENYEALREQYGTDKQNSLKDFNDAIAKKTAEYEGLTNKNTKKANNLLQQIANLEIRKANVQEDYNRRIENVTKRIDSMATQKFEKSERRASQSEIREQLFKDTGIVSESLDHAKNISKAMMHNTDPIRLQEMVFGKELGGKINEIVFQQVKHNTAEKIRFQNKERSEIEELGIRPRSKESAATQKYGEKQYVDETGQVTKYGDAELKAEFPKVEDQEKIKKAARVIRGKYDTYIDMVNAEITKYGYDPIPKRQDYMRHFQELNDVFSRYGLPFNMQSAQANDLPTDINGLTADLKPGKNWFASALRRKGVKTTYDAITGIDGYIEGIGNLIYHTGDIQKLRGFEDYIREIYGQEHGFDNLDNLPDAEKAIRMSKIQDNHLGNYAAWVREYTNALAGKKAMVDRAFEDIFGRRIYSTLNEIKSQVGSNMVGLNIGSALTNPISMTQALAKTSKLATVKGYADTVKNIFIKDNFVEQNDFLTNRFGSDILSSTAWQKMRNAGQIFMTGTDWFASNAITRSKFYELKAKGLSDADAHKQAGDFAARILGDRSQGATPTLYNSKMLGLVTQFQLEVNNQLYSMFYDTISDAKQKAKTKGVLPSAAGATFVLGQLAAYQHIYNNLYESIAGRRPAFDIIAMLATALGIGGDEEDEEKTAGDRLFEAADMLVDSLPYVSLFTGGGRIPVSEALPIKELFSGKDEYGNDKSRLETLGETIPYYLLPTGYSQLKKTTSGLGMYDDDLPIAGSYTDSGNLRFTAEDDPMSKLQAGIFGQWSSSNAKEYIDSEFKAIDKSNVEELVDLGFDSTEYKKYKEGLNEIKKMELEDGESRATYLFDYINKQDVTEEQKSVMIKNVLSEVETEDLSQLDMSSDEIVGYYKAKTDISQQIAEYTNNKKLLTGDTDSEEYKEAIGSLSNDKKAKIIDTIKNTNLPDDQKAYLYGKYYASDKTLEKITSSGISFDNYLTYQKDSLSLETSEDKAEYLYNANMSEKAKTVIYETSVLTGFDNEKKYKDYKTVKAAGVDINSWLSYTKQEFKADKNSKGNSISGSRKNKVTKYINSLNLSIPQKAIMLRTEYPSEDKYNKQIVNYVSNLSLSYEEKIEIFENIGMTVKNNRVYWD